MRSAPKRASQPSTCSGSRTASEPTTTRSAPASRWLRHRARVRTPPPVCTRSDGGRRDRRQQRAAACSRRRAPRRGRPGAASRAPALRIALRERQRRRRRSASPARSRPGAGARRGRRARRSPGYKVQALMPAAPRRKFSQQARADRGGALRVELRAAATAARAPPRRTRSPCVAGRHACRRSPARRSCARSRPARRRRRRRAADRRARCCRRFQPMCGTRAAAAAGMRAHAAGQQAQAFDLALLRALEQQLHAQADAQQRLRQFAAATSTRPSSRSRAIAGAGRADAGQDHPLGLRRWSSASRAERARRRRAAPARSAPSRCWRRRHRSAPRSRITARPWCSAARCLRGGSPGAARARPP